MDRGSFHRPHQFVSSTLRHTPENSISSTCDWLYCRCMLSGSGHRPPAIPHLIHHAAIGETPAMPISASNRLIDHRAGYRAAGGIRTHDLVLTKDALYQLSYSSQSRANPAGPASGKVPQDTRTSVRAPVLPRPWRPFSSTFLSIQSGRWESNPRHQLGRLELYH